MRKFLLLAILLLPGKSLLLAQSVPTIKLSEIRADTPLLDMATWRVTASSSSPIDTLTTSTFGRPAPGGIIGQDSVQWLHFDLLNDLPSPQRRIFQSSA